MEDSSICPSIPHLSEFWSFLPAWRFSRSSKAIYWNSFQVFLCWKGFQVSTTLPYFLSVCSFVSNNEDDDSSCRNFVTLDSSQWELLSPLHILFEKNTPISCPAEWHCGYSQNACGQVATCFSSGTSWMQSVITAFHQRFSDRDVFCTSKSIT